VLAGFKNNGLTDGPSVWIPPVLGPIVGGILGGVAYDLFIGSALIKADRIKAADRPDGEDPTHKE
jgi:glycerol uptake facilitator protein